MLWWLIGAWAASGLLIPVLLLLSMGRGVLVGSSNDMQAAGASLPPTDSERATPTRGRMGRYLLSGLAGAAAVTLLCVGSFSYPIRATGPLYSTFAGDQTATLQSTETSLPVERTVPSVKPADRREDEDGRHDLARQADLGAPQSPSSWTVSDVTPPAYPERPGKRPRHHGRRGPVSAYVAQSHRGTWLFPPNANAGGTN
jgi:hypothetical protein